METEDQFIERFGGHFFPFPDCDFRYVRDHQIVNNLKETACSMSKVGSQ